MRQLVTLAVCGGAAGDGCNHGTIVPRPRSHVSLQNEAEHQRAGRKPEGRKKGHRPESPRGQDCRRRKRAEKKEVQAHQPRRRRRKGRNRSSKPRSPSARQGEAKQKAENAKIEEYEAYIAQIGLANAKINDNAYDYALHCSTRKSELRVGGAA